MGKKRRKYTAEFKRDAVNLVITQGYSYAGAGRSLGINPNMLSRWQREQEAQGEYAYPGNGRLTPEQQRLHELEEDDVQDAQMSRAQEAQERLIIVFKWSVTF